MKILLVDDSGTMRAIQKRCLLKLGVSQDDVVEAENGQVALEAYRADSFAIILTDQNMPVMDGIDFLKNLRQLPGGDGPVVVFCTTENDVNHIQEAMEAGANEYIMKPFDGEIIQAKFAQVGLL